MRSPLPCTHQGRGATSPEVLPVRGWGLTEVTQRQGGALHRVRQLKLGARVTPAATPPGPAAVASAAPAPQLLGRAMGTRDDEYDYLFKGECLGRRVPVRARDTPGGPARGLEPCPGRSPPQLPPCCPDGGPAGRRSSCASGRAAGPRRPSLCVFPDGCVPHGLAVSSLGISGPSSWMHAAGLTSPSDRPLPRLSTHFGAPTLRGFCLFICLFVVFFPFHFLSFPLPPSEPFLGFGQIRPSQGPHPHPCRPRGQYPRTDLSLPADGQLCAFPFHLTFRAAVRPGWWEGRPREGKRACPSPLACVHLSQCPGRQMTSHLAFLTPFLLVSLLSYNQTRITPLLGFREGAADGWWLLSLPDLKAQFLDRKGCALHKY